MLCAGAHSSPGSPCHGGSTPLRVKQYSHSEPRAISEPCLDCDTGLRWHVRSSIPTSGGACAGVARHPPSIGADGVAGRCTIKRWRAHRMAARVELSRHDGCGSCRAAHGVDRTGERTEPQSARGRRMSGSSLIWTAAANGWCRLPASPTDKFGVTHSAASSCTSQSIFRSRAFPDIMWEPAAFSAPRVSCARSCPPHEVIPFTNEACNH
jgi:hypothetical protein